MAHCSLSIGLNFVDPAGYDGWDGKLAACEKDADDMFAIANAQGYAAQVLKREKATSAAVLAALANAAKTVKAGEHFFLTYSGHGGQVPDTNGDEPDHYDETWCLYDRMLLDDELYAMFGRFAPGARIFVLSDSCHSGSVTREVFRPRNAEMRGEQAPKWLPLAKSEQIYKNRQAMFDSIQQLAGPAEKGTVRACVLLISGCRDNEVSYDGPVNGAFTTQVLKAWNKGAFKGNYRLFQEQVTAGLAGQQHPQYFLAGTVDKGFERMKPFVTH
jgi:hypothetical protein